MTSDIANTCKKIDLVTMQTVSGGRLFPRFAVKDSLLIAGGYLREINDRIFDHVTY